ncbi:MAG: hypothetical protein KA369_10465 [Spirochaetes bacterium]|nr:hypothetical protein [Spirochaetota bacterium]
MIIEIKKLQYLINKYTDEFNCFYLHDTVIEGKKYRAGSEVLLLHANQLQKNGVKELDVRYDVTLYEYLIREYPVEYRRPVRWVDSVTMEKLLAELDLINAQSKRKRFFQIIGDIYWNDGRQSQQEIVFRHGERLDLHKWKGNKIYVEASQKFFLRSSENGIILYGSIQSNEYAERDGYRKSIDLVGSMLSHKFDKKFEISPDFIPNKDVYRVEEPGRLAEEYIGTNARLVAFSEALTNADKEALLQVKRHDPFVRMMVIPPLSPDTIDDVLIQLKMVYNTDRWKK